MRLAHVRLRHAPAGTPWRLVGALGRASEDPPGAAGPTRWFDLEAVRRRRIHADPRLEHNAVLFRHPVTTLDDHLARGLRLVVLSELVETFEPRDDDDPAVLEAGDLRFGPPILQPPSLRDFYAFERHVATIWSRRDLPVPEAWYRLPIFYFSNVSELRGPEEAVWAPDGSVELDYELEVCALVDTPAVDLAPERAAEAVGGYMILNDWSARDLQRDETTVRLGPAKGKDFATSIGPWIVTPDELEDRRAERGYDLVMTATVNGNETSRGTWASIAHGVGAMIARASADVHLRPGDLIGSGTVGGGCLLEIRDETLGRWLEPGDDVILTIERLGQLKTPIVARPGRG